MAGVECRSYLWKALLLSLLIAISICKVEGGEYDTLADNSDSGEFNASQPLGGTCTGNASDCDPLYGIGGGPHLNPGKILNLLNSARLKSGAKKVCNSSVLYEYAKTWVNSIIDGGSNITSCEGEMLQVCKRRVPQGYVPEIRKEYASKYFLYITNGLQKTDPASKALDIFYRQTEAGGLALTDYDMTDSGIFMRKTWGAMILAKFVPFQPDQTYCSWIVISNIINLPRGKAILLDIPKDKRK